MPSIRLEIARNYFFTFRFNIWNRLLKWSRRGSSFRLSHILRSVYKSDALTNWALRLACWSGGIIFAFIARGRGLDFCASPIFYSFAFISYSKNFQNSIVFKISYFSDNNVHLSYSKQCIKLLHTILNWINSL